MPPFGDILNASIQAVKQLGNVRATGINPKNFQAQVYENAHITPAHAEITFLEPVLSFNYDEDYIENALDELIRLSVICMSAMGLIKDDAYPLIVHQGDSFIDFVAFNSKVTPENIIKIDPLGKIYFWLMGNNFTTYTTFIDRSDKAFVADLNRYENLSFLSLKALNRMCYGEDGDPLINHLINETMRRTSVFMNNYADVELSNDYVKVTHEKLLATIHKLTPLQFEHLCIEVVKGSLKADNPQAIFETFHVGKTNDGGIDGKVVQTSPDGSKDTYYIQAKLYAPDNKISNHHLRNFVGGFPPDKNAHHGIFITTSNFTAPAIDYASSLENHNLILVNRIELLDQMLTHEIGIERFTTEVMVLNKDFFRKLKKY